MKLSLLKVLYKKFDSFVLKINNNQRSYFQLFRHAIGVVWNYIVYEASITDYFELSLYKKNHREKKEYLTYPKARKFAEKADSSELISKYASKKLIYKELNSFVKRDQLFTTECSYEEFSEFVKKHSCFLLKPDKLDCGRGIELIDASKYSIEELYQKIVQTDAVIDELIDQHPYLKQIAPSSVNTVRIFTLKGKDKIHFIGACLRIGNGSSYVDNYSAGGIVAALDISTGKVIDLGENAVGKRYQYHPYTGIDINGLEVPNWDMVLDFTRQCAEKMTLRYVAWDIAVRENDCVLIEANSNGMTNTIQIAGAPGRKGQYEELLRVL